MIRNLLIVLLATQLLSCTSPHTDSGYTPLFNGQNFQGWTGDTAGYVIVNREIQSRVPEPGAHLGNLFTAAEYSNFILRFEFKLTPGANNGLGIRAPLSGDAAYVGIELQILENTHEKWAHLKPWQFHGSVYGVAAAKRGFQKPPGEWNQQEVLVDGRHIKVTLNGHVILDVDLDEVSRDGTIDGNNHPGLDRASGHIGFLGHGDKVAFRNIELKPLP